MPETTPARTAADAPRGLAAAVAALVLLLVAADLLAPHSLTRGDQGKQAQYLLDAAGNGQWLAPWDVARGEPATKPPLYTWFAVLCARVLGRIDETALRLPAALAAAGLAAVTFLLGRRLADARTGAWAALALATTYHFGRMAALARTDGLLALLLNAQVLVLAAAADPARISIGRTLALSALCAAACLTKGPAGLLACAVAAAWLLMTGRRGLLRAAVIPAVAGSLLLVAWFEAALRARGEQVWSTMVEGELVRHATEGQWWNPLYYGPVLAGRFLPWTLLLPAAAISARRAWRAARPGPPPDAVALPVAWLLAHLVAFGLFPHKRPDLAYPLVPALCLLVARLAGEPAPRRTALACAALFTAGAAAALLWRPEAFVVPVPAWAVALSCALFVAAAALAWRAARRNPGGVPVATGSALLLPTALAGVALFVMTQLEPAPQVAAWSWRDFGLTARAEAARLDAPLLHAGFRANAALFQLGIARPPCTDADLLATPRPFVLVTTPTERERLGALLGPLEELAHAEGEPGSADIELVLLRAGR